MARGGYPEVISMPHIETPIKRGSKSMLFKGVDPERFTRYFSQGGIEPYYPDRPWLTNHLGTALEYGGLSTLNNPGLKTGGTADRLCVAVIDPDILDRGNLRSTTGQEFPLLSWGLRHYYGREHIDWKKILELVVTPKVMASIMNTFNHNRPRDLSSTEFVEKLSVVDEGSISEIKLQAERAVAKITHLDPQRSYNPW